MPRPGPSGTGSTRSDGSASGTWPGSELFHQKRPSLLPRLLWPTPVRATLNWKRREDTISTRKRSWECLGAAPMTTPVHRETEAQAQGLELPEVRGRGGCRTLTLAQSVLSAMPHPRPHRPAPPLPNDLQELSLLSSSGLPAQTGAPPPCTSEEGKVPGHPLLPSPE